VLEAAHRCACGARGLRALLSPTREASAMRPPQPVTIICPLSRTMRLASLDASRWRSTAQGKGLQVCRLTSSVAPFATLLCALMFTQQGAAGASWLSCTTEGRARRRRRSATQQGAVCASQGPPRNGSSSRSYGSDGAGRKVQGPQFRGGACTLARFCRRQPYALCVCSWPRRSRVASLGGAYARGRLALLVGAAETGRD